MQSINVSPASQCQDLTEPHVKLTADGQQLLLAVVGIHGNLRLLRQLLMWNDFWEDNMT